MSMLQLVSVGINLGASSFGPFTLQVEPGERIAILGPSGAGKSTLLKLMSRECRPAAGQVLFKGTTLSSWSLSDLSRSRAVLPQSSDVAFGLQTDLVVGLGRVACAHDPELAQIVAASAKLAHASHLLGRRFDTLSGGEQARVQLARVFAQLWDARDGLILVDEPLAALDPGLQFDLLDSLEAYACARCHAVIAILHDINQAMQGFDRLLLVKDGRLVGDLPSCQDAVPALASLYGIPLECITNSQGALVITPLRRSSPRSVVIGAVV
jgi:iron complex transport system ATP-binding protein